MRAISLWQPWATLIEFGLKQYETRSWKPHKSAVGQPLLIHAAKRKMTKEETDYLAELKDCYGERIPSTFPYGSIIAICTLEAVYPTEEVRDNLPLALELDVGDWSDGRYCWKLSDLKRLEPVAFKGSQGFFEVPNHLVKAAA